MNIQLSIRHMTAPEGIKKLVHDLCKQLHNKYKAIQYFDVKIEDINGPYKAGIDKRCHLKIRGHEHLAIDVDKIDSDLYCAIELAFRRLTHLLKRSFAKQVQAEYSDYMLSHDIVSNERGQ